MECKEGKCPHWSGCPRAKDSKDHTPPCTPMSLESHVALPLNFGEECIVRSYRYTCNKCGSKKSLLSRYNEVTCDIPECDGVAYLTREPPTPFGGIIK